MTKQMNPAQEANPAALIVNIALSDLILSPMNPRQDAGAEGIEALAASIRACGLMQNLSGIAGDGGKTEIVAGGRRLRALRLLAENGEAPEYVPVRLARDEAEARMWAATENHQREDLHPADEIRAFYAMAESGATVAQIASAFAETEAHVRRRLRLGCLPAAVLDALQDDSINLSMAQAFAASDDETLILSVLERVQNGGHWHSSDVRRLLLPDAVSASDRRARFVGLDAYRDAGGKVTADLFTEQTSLHDPDILDRLFAEKLESEVEKALAAGWKWAETCPDTSPDWSTMQRYMRVYPVPGELTEAQAARFDALSAMDEQGDLDSDQETELDGLQAVLDGCVPTEQRALAGLYLYVDWHGDLMATDGLVQPEDFPAAVEAGFIEAVAAEARLARINAKADDADQPAKEKLDLSGALIEDLRAMRNAAIQGKLLDKPEMTLDLLAFTLAQTYGGPLGIRRDESNITPSVERGYAPDQRFSVADHEDGDEAEDEAEEMDALAAFRARGKKHRNSVLAHMLARTLLYGNAYMTGIEAELGASIRQVWTPTAENFFSRVNAAYLENLLADLTGCDRSGGNFKAFARSKKKEKAATLERLFTDPETQKLWQIDAKKKARIDDWVPTGF